MAGLHPAGFTGGLLPSTYVLNSRGEERGRHTANRRERRRGEERGGGGERGERGGERGERGGERRREIGRASGREGG